MARLTNLRPTLGTLAPRFARLTDGSGHSDVTEPWRRWYKLNRWVKLRERILLRDRYTCKDCGTVHIGKGTAVVDHVRPHRGNEALFWSEANLQVLCKSPCHDRHKQRLERNDPDRMPPGTWY